MTKTLLLALTALPLVACVGSVDEVEGGDETSELEATEQPLRVYEYLVDFDQVFTAPAFPSFGSTPVANGATVDDAYQGYGVTFSCATLSRAFATTSCTSGHVFAVFSAFSNTNVVSPLDNLQAFDARYGAVEARFATPRTWVSIDVTPVMLPEHLGTVHARPWIAAYDVNDQWIATTVYPVSYPQAGWDQMRTLSVSAPSATVKFVRFSSEYFSGSPIVLGKFDNLRFNGDPLIPVSELPPKTPVLRPIF